MNSQTLVLFSCWIGFIYGQSWNNLGADQWSRDYGYYRQRVNPNVCSYETCRLPKCFCAGKDAPRKMDASVLPQIVMFTFDDAVNEQVYDYYTELFPKELVNPNGCPVTITFFVSHNWTDYGMVRKLYDRGHEIASHSITHRMPQSWWRYGPAEDWEMEIQGQRENIVQKASIPLEEIRGMRAPFLDTGGDEQFKMLQKHGFEYDASFMTGPHDKGGAWPFTLNYVPSWEYCTNLNCPKEKHAGIWEVPLNRWVGIDGNGCSMVDACQQQPRHKGETLAYLWQNFNRHYYGNRSPVGVNMHATWFKTDHHFEAMKEFVKTISDMDDVYIITVHQTLEWMKSPQTIDRVVNFRPWLKTCNSPGSDSNNLVIKKDPEPNSIPVGSVEAKELTDNNVEFDNNVIYIERAPQSHIENEYDFGDQSHLNGPNYREIERANVQSNIEGEIIEDYRFSDRRPLQRSELGNRQYSRRRLRPVDTREMPQEIGDQLPIDKFHRFPNIVSNTRMNPETNDEYNGEGDVNDIIINEVPRYEDGNEFEEMRIEGNIKEAVNINAIEEMNTNKAAKIGVPHNTTNHITYKRNENEFESYISYDTDSEVEDVKIQNHNDDIEIKFKKNKATKVGVVSLDKGFSSTSTTTTPSLTTTTTTSVPPRVSKKFPTGRQRIRPNRPRLGGIPGRSSDLQSRQRNRSSANSANSQQLNMATIVTSGTIAVFFYYQMAWL